MLKREREIQYDSYIIIYPCRNWRNRRGYLIWLWLREGKPFYWGIIGGIALALYGVVATFQSFPTFGRVYAAYGGVFIVLSILWGGALMAKARSFRLYWRRDMLNRRHCDIAASLLAMKKVTTTE